MTTRGTNRKEMDRKKELRKCKKIKEDINELKSIIKQIKSGLNTDTWTFKDAQNTFDDFKIPKKKACVASYGRLMSELYRFAGIFCVKSTEKECVFNFSSFRKYNKNEIYGVQVIKDNNKITLGKWMMPSSIDLYSIVSKVSIENLPIFWKLCKQYVDCYFLRCEQYNTLMETISQTKNCMLQTNLGHTCFILDRTEVYNVANELYFNLTVYILYKYDEVRPYETRLRIKTTNNVPDNMEKSLKSLLRCFKKFDLHTAYNKILNNGAFIWTKESDNDSSTESHGSNSMEEQGLLEDLSLLLGKDISLTHKKRKKKNTDTISKSLEPKKQPVPYQKKKAIDLKHYSKDGKSIQISKFVSDENKMKQKRLKQTKLKFQKNTDLESRTKHNPCTSTPRRTEQASSKFLTMASIDNISSIEDNDDKSIDKTTESNDDSIMQKKGACEN